MRVDLLREWVSQPPAGPNKQYLRDAEHGAALAQLGERERVLDLASEVSVTRAIEAGHLARVDFAAAASDYAGDLLGGAVDDYEVATPAEPSLPYADDSFDGVVSVGPYDWKFLDVAALTAEARRVLAPDGRFVFSVPTPRSPYYDSGRNRHRYYEPGEALGLVAPEWTVGAADLLFQYPSRVHRLIEAAPAPVQARFADLARRLSERLTARERWKRASYLVLGASPLPYERSLADALECLFRPTDARGFWHDGEGRFVRALEYALDAGGRPERWTVDDGNEWRYAPLALLGALRWRVSAVGTAEYDAELRRALEWFQEAVGDGRHREMPRYGVGPLVAAFALAARAFGDDHRATAGRLFRHSRRRFDLDHREDGLLVYGWAELHDLAPSIVERDALEEALWLLNERLDPYRGLFVAADDKSGRHQNQMYALWGFCRAIEATGQAGYLSSAEQVLDRTVASRMREDGAFLWDDAPLGRKCKRAVSRRLLEGAPLRADGPHYWHLLFSCHQAFFASAVAHYYRAGGGRSYDRAVARAMAWIYGGNALGRDLHRASGIGVPLRHLTVDGRIDAAGQRFVGAYEAGSYLMALTFLTDGTCTSGPPVP